MEIRERIESWIKNFPKIIKNPNTPYFTEGDQTYYHCVHPPKKEGDLPLPYTKEELDEINELEKFPFLKIGHPQSNYCLHCGQDLDIIRKPDNTMAKSHDVDKYCCNDCKSYRGKKNQRRKKINANLIVWGKDNYEKNFVKAVYHYQCENPKRLNPHIIQINLPTRNRKPKQSQ